MKLYSYKHQRHLLYKSIKGNKRKHRKNFKNRRSEYRLPIQYTIISIPERFCIIDNMKEVLSCFSKVRALSQTTKHLKIDLSDVKHISIGTVTILLSILKDIVKRNNIRIKGINPRDQEVKDIINSTGFFKHIDYRLHTPNSKSTILCSGDADTPQSLLAQEIPTIVKTIWGKEGRYPPLYECLIEMMRNSCDHAFKDKKEVTWHLAIYHLEKENRVIFSFVDNGRGVLSTLRKGVLKRYLKFFENDAEILFEAYDKGSKSRTGLEWRGKGLPTILENSQNHYICQLKVISNNAYIDFENRTKKKLSNQFAGTCYIWEINNSCIDINLK